MLFVLGIIPMIMFIFFIVSGYDLLMSAVAGIIMSVLGIFLYGMIVRHPFLSVLEGAGLLVMTYDSTGVIDTFIAQVVPPFVRSKFMKEPADSLYDREGVFYLKAPKKAEVTSKGRNGKVEMIMSYNKKDENDITFAFGSLPCLIYNKNMQCFLTKKALSAIETESVIKHLVIYLKKKTEELTSVLRDFARYVVETTKPQKQKSIWNNWMFWIGIAILAMLVIYMFWPQISATFSGVSVPALPATDTGIIPR